LENSIRIHELHRHVCPLGQQDDIPALMGVADQLAMLLLFDDPTFRQRLGAAGTKRARREFSKERMIGQMNRVYRAAVETKTL
jgi:glycosyltransferase involved in cell wall biosynthesis